MHLQYYTVENPSYKWQFKSVLFKGQLCRTPLLFFLVPSQYLLIQKSFSSTGLFRLLGSLLVSLGMVIFYILGVW